MNHINSIFDILEGKQIRLSGLVHAAGVSVPQPVRVLSLHTLNEVFNINLFSFMEITKHFIKRSISEDWSSVIAISSMASTGCEKGQASYAASKSGLDAYVKVLSKEVLLRRIRVNCINPSFVDTPMGQQYLERALRQPLGIIDPVQIAYLVEFLLSDKSIHITGSSFQISSGV